MRHQINLPRNLGRVLDQYVEARTTSVALQGWIPSRTVDLTGTARAGRAKWARLRFARDRTEFDQFMTESELRAEPPAEPRD